MTTQADFLKQAVEKGYENGFSTYRSIPSATGEYGRPGTNYAYSFKTDYGTMMFYPESFVNKGINVDGKTYYNSWFQNENNLNNFALNSTYVDLSGIKDNGRGYATKGYLIPLSAPDTSFPSRETLYNQPTSEIGSITGLSKTADGKLVYAVERSQGKPGGYIQPAAPSIKLVGMTYVDTGFGTVSVPQYANVGPVTSEIYNPAARPESNNIIDKLITNIGPIVKLAAIVTENPGLYAAAASYDIANRNWLGAALSVAGMYSNAPGVDAKTAEAAKNIYSGLQVANAIKTNNPIGALTALGGMSGLSLPPEFMKATQLIAVNNAIQKKDWSALAVAVGNIADNKDLSYAGKAANVVNALKTGDIAKITRSLYGFIPELREGYKTGDISAIFDKMGYSLGDNEKQLLESGKSESPEELTKTITGFAPNELAPEPLTSEQAEDLYQQAAKNAGFPDLQTQIAYGGNLEAYKDALASHQAQDNISTPTAPVPQQESKPVQEKPDHQSYFNNIVKRYGTEKAAEIYAQTIGYSDLQDVVNGYLHPPAPATPTPAEPLVPEIADNGKTGNIQDSINVLNPTTPTPEQVAPEKPPEQTQEPEPPPDYHVILNWFISQYGQDRGFQMFSDYMTANGLGNPNDYISQPTTGGIENIIDLLNPTTPTPEPVTPTPTPEPVTPAPTPEPPPDYKSILDYFVNNYGQARGFQLFSDYMTANGLGNPNDYISQPITDAADDGTTGGIQDIIDVINPPVKPESTEPPPVEQPPVQPPVQTDTTDGGSLGDASDTDVNLEGGDLGMTEDEWQKQFYEQIGIDPASLSDLPPAEQSEIDAILGLGQKATSAQIARAKSIASAAKTPVKPPVTPPVKPPTTPTTPTTPATPNVTAAPATPALSSNNLLALLALDNQPAQQQQVQPTPLADIKYYYDFNNDIGSNIFAGDMVPQMPQNTQGPATFSFSDGGEVEDDFSVDDLIGMLKGD